MGYNRCRQIPPILVNGVTTGIRFLSRNLIPVERNLTPVDKYGTRNDR